MTRRATRQRLMQWFYSSDMQKSLDQISKGFPLDEIKKDREKNYALDLLEAYEEHHVFIDELLNSLSHSWPLERMGRVDLALLRLAATEIYYLDDIPVEVSISEAMELSKRYSTEESTAFINGILGSVVEKKDEQA